MKKYMKYAATLAMVMYIGMPVQAECEEKYDDRPHHPMANFTANSTINHTVITDNYNYTDDEADMPNNTATEISVPPVNEEITAEVPSSEAIDNRIRNGSYIKAKTTGVSMESEESALKEAQKLAVEKVVQQLVKKGNYEENTLNALTENYEKYIINYNVVKTEIAENNISVDIWANVSLDKLKNDIKAYDKNKVKLEMPVIAEPIITEPITAEPVIVEAEPLPEPIEEPIEEPVKETVEETMPAPVRVHTSEKIIDRM